jgi:hypothetical protein
MWSLSVVRWVQRVYRFWGLLRRAFSASLVALRDGKHRFIRHFDALGGRFARFVELVTNPSFDRVHDYRQPAGG